MKSFSADIESLLSVAAAVIDADGVLIEANTGFLRLLPANATGWAGAGTARFFVQPSFSSLLQYPPGAGYSGLMTIGDYQGETRTMRGHAMRTAQGLRLLAESDVEGLEKLNQSMLDINREASVEQSSLAAANIALKQREVHIVAASLTDSLTGIGNRRRLEQALATEVERARRQQGPLSAIMADIDHFKRVNDEYGHGAGDTVLARVAALLKSNTRTIDIVTRFGGEEFVVLMPHTSLAQALDKAERLRAALEAEIIEPLTRPVTASFGVAELATDEDGASLLARIDAALYRAKEEGRNRVVADDAMAPT